MSIESFLANNNMRNNSKTKKEISSVILFGLVLILAIGLRLYNLGTESYWIDEIASVIEGQQSVQQLVFSGRLDQPLAYYLPFRLWLQTFGTTEISTRLFSVLTGIGAIVLIYLIGRDLFSKGVGLVGAFLMSISVFQISYSQEARFYSLLQFATLLSFFFFILAFRSQRLIYFVLYALASIIMVYSNALGVFILVAQNLFFMLQIRKYKSLITIWVICQTMIFLALIPYYPLIFGDVGGKVVVNIAKIQAPLWRDPLRTIYRFIMPARLERSWASVLINYAIAGSLLVISTWIYALGTGKSNWFIEARELLASVREEVPEVGSKFLLIICWLLCPILVPFIISMTISPIYLDRYMIGAAPASYLLLALGIFSIRKMVPLFISLIVLVILILPGLRYYYVTDLKEQWKEAAAYVDQNTSPGEMIVVAPNTGIGMEQKTFNWYYKGTLPSCGISKTIKDYSMRSKALEQCISGYTRFWVIIRDTSEDNNSTRSFFLNTNQINLHLIKRNQFVDVSVYLFEVTK